VSFQIAYQNYCNMEDVMSTKQDELLADLSMEHDASMNGT